MTLWARLRAQRDRLRGRKWGELAKQLELATLGSRASTYCYHHPSHVLIELTTQCNLRCRWCNQSDPEWQESHGHQDMPFPLLERILTELRGSRVLLLYNIGEPLLYPRIYDAIRLARRFIPQVRLTTNGLLLTREVADRLQESGLTQLNVSIDSPDPQLMKRIRGASLEKIGANLEALPAGRGYPVELWTVISEANVESLAALPAWAARFPRVRFVRFQLQNGVEGGEAEGLPPLRSRERFLRLQEEVSWACRVAGLGTNIEALKFYPSGFHEKQARGICRAPFNQLVAINVEGHLAPCCSYGTHSLGDVGRDGFARTWNGGPMRAWRRDMLEERYCAYCSEWCGYRQGGEP